MIAIQLELGKFFEFSSRKDEGLESDELCEHVEIPSVKEQKVKQCQGEL